MSNKFIIRHADLNDVPALAAVHVATFIETHGGFNPPTIELRQQQWQQIFKDRDDSWFCLIIQNDEGNIIGFAKGQPYKHSDLPEYAGELNKIYILKKYHRLGLGQQLLYKVANEFLFRGISSMLLFGDANSPSNRFYERMDAQKLITKAGEFHGGYGWTDLNKLVNAGIQR